MFGINVTTDKDFKENKDTHNPCCVLVVSVFSILDKDFKENKDLCMEIRTLRRIRSFHYSRLSCSILEIRYEIRTLRRIRPF